MYIYCVICVALLDVRSQPEAEVIPEQNGGQTKKKKIMDNADDVTDKKKLIKIKNK